MPGHNISIKAGFKQARSFSVILSKNNILKTGLPNIGEAKKDCN